MNQEEYDQALMEEMEAINQEKSEDNMQDQMEMTQAWNEANDEGQKIEDTQNAHSFLHKATFGDEENTIRTTFLHEGELGKGLFTVRFIMDMVDVSKFYLDPVCKELKINNRISEYLQAKIINVTTSGMSNKGFAMNLNVTRKMDSTRQRATGNIENLKGGNK